MKLLIMGGPGSGKGTQARRLALSLNIPFISTGDILRKHIRKETVIGKQIKEGIEKGQMAPDDLIYSLLKERFALPDCLNGFILDGFPRNLQQAQMLYELVGSIDKAVYIQVPDDTIKKRMAGRLTCPSCGAMFHLEHNMPKNPGICDLCQSGLIQRKDDKEKTVEERLKIFHQITEPVTSYYQDKQLLLSVDGLKSIDEITDYILANLKE